MEVIDHNNFNPRIIDHLTSQIWLADVSTSDYPIAFKSALTNPAIIWEKVFHTQISDHARLILTLLVSMPSEVFLRDLRKVFITHIKPYKGPRDIEIEFDNALHELEGNFTITKVQKKGTVIAFHNPSIADFLEREIETRPFALYKILQNAVFFEQLEFILGSESKHKLLLNTYMDSRQVLYEKLNSLLTVAPCKLSLRVGLVDKISYKDRSSLSVIRRIGYIASKVENRNFSYLIKNLKDWLKYIEKKLEDGNLGSSDLVFFLHHIIPLHLYSDDEKLRILQLAKTVIIENTDWISNIEIIFKFLDEYPCIKSPEDIDAIQDRISYIVYGFSEDENYDTLVNELEDLEYLKDKHQIDVSDEVEIMEELIRKFDKGYGYPEDPILPWSDDGDSDEAHISNEEITSMFSTLVEDII